jgi:hypothetical protein
MPWLCRVPELAKIESSMIFISCESVVAQERSRGILVHKSVRYQLVSESDEG